MMKQGLFILLVFITSLGFAQEDEYVYGDTQKSSKSVNAKGGGFDWDRATIGGGFYASFGSNSYFLMSPSFGYFLTDNILAGVSVKYAYENLSTGVPFSYKSNMYGGSIYGRYLFDRLPFLAHAELEYANIKIDFDSGSLNDLNLNLVNPYVGGGLQQRMSDFSYFYVLVLYNLNETKESNVVQQNPDIRIGISIGL